MDIQILLLSLFAALLVDNFDLRLSGSNTCTNTTTTFGHSYLIMIRGGGNFYSLFRSLFDILGIACLICLDIFTLSSSVLLVVCVLDMIWHGNVWSG